MVVCESPVTLSVQGPQPLTYRKFRLFPFRSPLLRKSQLVSFPEDTEMFHFSSLAWAGLCIHPVISPIAMGCPIRKSSDHCVCATPRSLSQLTTFFIADWYPGILRKLLVASQNHTQKKLFYLLLLFYKWLKEIEIKSKNSIHNLLNCQKISTVDSTIKRLNNRKTHLFKFQRTPRVSCNKAEKGEFIVTFY